MKMKLFAVAIALSLLLSGMLVAVGGEAMDGSVGEGIEENELLSAQEIYDWHDLNATREDLSADYILMNDLDETTDGYGDLVDTTDGWEPIGNTDTPFTGTFEGNGYEIQDLYINRTDEKAVGLFGVTEGAELTEVMLIDADVNGGYVVGSIAGNNGGKIYDSYTTGSITSLGGGVGGLVGHNTGTISNSYSTEAVSGHVRVLAGENYEGTIFGSYAILDEKGDGVGGLVGYNTGTISTSYATGDVIDLDFAPEIGGLVGENHQGPIFDSYATGDVNGTRQVGGLVGYLYDSTVCNSYATGKVSGKGSTSGLVGESYECTIENSFWNLNASGQNESDGGTSKTTDEMKDVATYTDTSTEGLEEPWDFVGDPNDDQGDEDIWDIDEEEEINDGYPFLSWQDVDMDRHRLEIGSEGEGSIEIDGQRAEIPYTGDYEGGEEIDLTVIPDVGYHFVEWTGDNETIADTEANQTTIAMEDNYTITAVFAINTYELTIDSTEGGSVVGPGDNTFEYDHGTVVDIEAVADEGYRFVEWTGDNGTIVDTTANQTTIEMRDNYSITAEFAPVSHELNIDSTKGGNVTYPGEGTFDYDQGTRVDLEAEADIGYHFVEWSGDASGTDPTINITMDRDKSITAHFEEEPTEITGDFIIEWKDEASYEDHVRIVRGTEVRFNGSEIETQPDQNGGLYYNWTILIEDDKVIERSGEEIWTCNEFTEVGEYTIRLNVTDGAGTYRVLEKTLVIETRPVPDLMVRDGKFSNDNPRVGDTVTISVNVTNVGESNATDVDAVLKVDGERVDVNENMVNDGEEVEIIEAGKTVNMRMNWEPEDKGERTVTVTITDTEEPAELQWDNEIEETIYIEDEDGDGGNGDTPGFTTMLLLLSAVVAVAIYYKKKR